MKTLKLSVLIVITLVFFGCDKSASTQQIIVIPNGDFEFWDNQPTLNNWQTNSCPFCVPPYDPYIVKKVTDAWHGQFAARFIYNDVYSSWAINKFAVSGHPGTLRGYIKSTIASGDTATIHVDLFSGNTIVDRGSFYEISSYPSYRKIDIPISQTTSTIDSALITIVGGKKQRTELYVDDLMFLKSN